MEQRVRGIGLIAAVFVLVGLGLGAVGYVGTNWATDVFLTGAEGETAAQFGPVFVALATFQVAVLALLVGPVLAAVLGLLVGSQRRNPTAAGIVTGSGALVGFLLMSLIAVPVAGVGGGSVPFSLVEFGVRVGLAAVPTTVVGGVAGAIGVAFVA